MDLRATILGLLEWKPAAGYDLKQIICDSEVFYWSGNNNQIYKTLLELQQEGLVTCQVQMQENLPARKIYSITEPGRAELRANLLRMPDLPELRNSFLIQLAWAEPLTQPELDALFDHYESELTDRLHLLEGLSTRPQVHPERSVREKYLWRQIAVNQIQTVRTELEWLRQTRAGLDLVRQRG
jgi:PadR family transcriptional regulator, regulatory protein AphA